MQNLNWTLQAIEEEPRNQSSLWLFGFPVVKEEQKANSSLLGFPAVPRMSLLLDGIRDAQQWQNF